MKRFAICLLAVGILLGASFLWAADRFIDTKKVESKTLVAWGGRSGLLIFIAMAIHSIPEGVAVGVGYASEGVYSGHLGSYVALAIAIPLTA